MQQKDICGQPTEAATVEAWQALLSQHFFIEHEVPGIRYGQKEKVRVDMLLHPKFEWRGGGNFPIALEIKKPTANSYKALAQAADYAQCRWISAKYSEPIQTYIAIYAPKFELPQIGFSPPHFLGSFGIMLMQLDFGYAEWFQKKPFRGLSLNISCHRVWSSEDGLVGNFSPKRKFGSR